MNISYSIKELKHFQKEAIQFFGAELMLLQDVIPKIDDGKLEKPAILLFSCGQTGEALINLSKHIPESFSDQAIMLSRAFLEAITNFVYLGVCDDKEYDAFMLYPVYKHYHNVGSMDMEATWNFEDEELNFKLKREKQAELKKIPIVQEALAIFPPNKVHKSWTKTSLSNRIEVINRWGKLLDVFFTLCKNRYYSDASETLHGSLYGCTHGMGAFVSGFDHSDTEALNKKYLKDNTCVLLHLGMLIHEAFTLIHYTNDIKEQWDLSYRNRNQALNFLYLVLEKKIPGFDEEQSKAFKEYFTSI